METITVLYIVLAAIVALGIVVLQYVYKQKAKSNVYLLLAFLRFIGIFGLLILLINPQFSQISYSLEKPNLVILADNSSSISESGDEIKEVISKLKSSQEISNKFRIRDYRFGDELGVLDSLTFKDKNTNIFKSLSALKDVFAREQTVTLLLSDGNQTIGQDYSYFKTDENNTLYTIVLGDTTKYKDLSVGPILTNKYAFLKNKFPLETYISYQGSTAVSTILTVKMNDRIVYRENFSFNNESNFKTISIELNANSVGIKNLLVEISQLPEERNIANNRRSTSIEVINEKTKIGLIADILHPDLGTLKKAIESNEQREVTILKPNVTNSTLDQLDLFIFYQPTISFKPSLNFAKSKNANTFIITGSHADYSFLNEENLGFEIENGYPKQEVFGLLNNVFSKYDISKFDLTDFPPLLSDAGPIIFQKSYEALLGTQIKGLNVQQPLLSIIADNSKKQALLVGENLWKWRMQTFRNTGDFINFDEFVGNLIRYLTSTKNKSRLNVEYEKIYEGSTNTIITATFFDEAFLFDPNVKMNIKVTNRNTNLIQDNPMVLKNGYFEADLSNLLAGEYDFRVSVANESKSEVGTFVISEFDMENQFVSSDNLKMEKLALNARGKQFYPSQIETLIAELIENDTYVPTEKSTENIVSLIDFKLLLAIIVFAFTAEWFIRKYNGLI
ncbi:VWA domain-containing protein [uncultured Maribacter sp.]|mgnify:CR=1 FL=1|uniref:VWA domain-containing protein n=1 Tax=uncultured Maribacter sp. TaxID=431308 RepID=UPI0030D9274F|tara:strand:- start:1883 stop:3910 length:2028 start_codon:yes stop_codon:yes gene_type:complete